MNTAPAPGTTWSFLGFDSAGWATILTGVIAVFIFLLGYLLQRRHARRDERSKMFAEALQAVEDYLEAPYLIRRRDGSAPARMDLVRHISSIQSRIEFYRAWLAIHAKPAVHEAYDAFVVAAKKEAGAQMTIEWKSRPTRRDHDVPIDRPYSRRDADQARLRVLRAMSVSLR
ncbi:hypothetical protein [Promicromonospora sp. NPDC019610]|uniref:hypothetical protein n=1 Tax=Promicromonospora sp. NPDC019610 TaxID=3364405 RepID=UPI0037A9886A